MAFKLRSGNKTSFKSMGSSPAKQKSTAKPDYIDIDGDGNTTESMKSAAKMYKESPAKQTKDADLREHLISEKGFTPADADKMIADGAYTKKDIKPGIKRKVVDKNPVPPKKSTAKVKKGSAADKKSQADFEPAYEGADYSQREIDAMTEEEKMSKIDGYTPKGGKAFKKEKSPAQMSYKSSPAKKYKSAAQRKAVHASKAESPAKQKKNKSSEKKKKPTHKVESKSGKIEKFGVGGTKVTSTKDTGFGF